MWAESSEDVGRVLEYRFGCGCCPQDSSGDSKPGTTLSKWRYPYKMLYGTNMFPELRVYLLTYFYNVFCKCSLSDSSRCQDVLDFFCVRGGKNVSVIVCCVLLLVNLQDYLQVLDCTLRILYNGSVGNHINQLFLSVPPKCVVPMGKAEGCTHIHCLLTMETYRDC